MSLRSLRTFQRFFFNFNFSQESTTTKQKLLSLSKLKNVEWKLSVGIASDSCTDLSSAQVTVQFTTQVDDQTLKNHTFDLTLDEFQNLHKHFNDMSLLMDNL
jgi:hypothetical protein